MALATSVSSRHTYCGQSEINFFSDVENGLSVTIDTERLHIRSVELTQDDRDLYVRLLKQKTQEEVADRMKNVWVKRWREQDPYSALVVFKKDTKEFLGHVSLDHTDQPGKSELTYCCKQMGEELWPASEIIRTVVKEYAPAIIERGYTLQGKPLERIVTMTTSNDKPTCRILEEVDMVFNHIEEKRGSLVSQYSIDFAPRAAFVPE